MSGASLQVRASGLGRMVMNITCTCAGYVPESCQRVFYGWAPGGDNLLLPNGVHIRLGKGSGFKTVLLEIHYNNIERLSDQTDASGFTAYATTRPRSHGCAPYIEPHTLPVQPTLRITE